VGNNPLSYTDPSGYLSWREVVGPVVAAIGFAACGQTCASLTWQLVAISAASGGAHAAANGGNFVEGAIIGAISGAAFSGIANAEFAFLGDLASVGRAASFGAVGGVSSVVSGGSFGHGFISAGVGGALNMSPYLQGRELGQIVGRTVIRSAVADTVTAATGGKFANGAATAAFASIVAEGVNSYYSNNPRPGESYTDFYYRTRSQELLADVWGLSAGFSYTKDGLVYGYSLTVALDSDGNFGIVETHEYGIGLGKGVSPFARAIYGGGENSINTLSGSGVSVSGTAATGSGSFSLPYRFTAQEGQSFPFGDHGFQAPIVELGRGLGPGVSGTYTNGNILYKNSTLGDFGRSLGGKAYDLLH
jgi:hypothetical protein